MDSDGDKTFFTVTMARVYAEQGRYEAAARIYRYLLDQTPDRLDLQKALDDVLGHLPESTGKWQDVAGLVERWVGLMLRCNALRQLQQKHLPEAGNRYGYDEPIDF